MRRNQRQFLSALEQGINFFDWANGYSHGENEWVVGRNLLSMIAREQLEEGE